MFNKKQKQVKAKTKEVKAPVESGKPAKSTGKKVPVKLTNADKKQIRDVISKHKPVSNKEKSAQESVPYRKV